MRLYGYDSKARSRKTFTKVEIRHALQDAAKGHGGPLARTTYQVHYEDNPGLPHPYTIIRRYEKWSRALKDAGLPTHTRSSYKGQTTQRDCLAALLAARDILGHLPSTGEYANLWTYGPFTGGKSLKSQGYPSVSTIRVKFAKWRDAVTEASRYIDKSICDQCGEPTASVQELTCGNCT